MNTKPIARRLRRIAPFTALAVAGLTICLTPAQAATTFMNGDFSNVMAGNTGLTTASQLFVSAQAGPGGGYLNGPTLPGWTTAGYEYIFSTTPGSPSNTNADNVGAQNEFQSMGDLFYLWGPGTPDRTQMRSAPPPVNPIHPVSNNLTAPPNGGNFVGLDGVQTGTLQGSIMQTISLTSTMPVTVSFNWAGAQQAGFGGANTEQLRVSLCAPGQTPGNADPGNPATPGGPTGNSCTAYTNILNNATMGFTGWQNSGTPSTSFTFNPTSIMETLMFTAIGTPNDRLFPPFVLLDGITVTQAVGAPEPATWSLLAISLAVMGVVAYRRRKSVRVPDQVPVA